MKILLDMIQAYPVVIFTTMTCPYCVKAKFLLDQKGVKYQEMDLTTEPNQRVSLVELSGGRRTVPQIFIHGKSIGGCDDLYQLEAQGKLDTLLSSSASPNGGEKTWNVSA